MAATSRRSCLTSGPGGRSGAESAVRASGLSTQDSGEESLAERLRGRGAPACEVFARGRPEDASMRASERAVLARYAARKNPSGARFPVPTLIAHGSLRRDPRRKGRAASSVLVVSMETIPNIVVWDAPPAVSTQDDCPTWRVDPAGLRLSDAGEVGSCWRRLAPTIADTGRGRCGRSGRELFARGVARQDGALRGPHGCVFRPSAREELSP